MSRNQGVRRTVRKTGWVVLVFALSIPYNLAKLAAEASGFSESSAAGIGLVAIVAAGLSFFVICQELPPDQ
jgi:hypothetical protein